MRFATVAKFGFASLLLLVCSLAPASEPDGPIHFTADWVDDLQAGGGAPVPEGRRRLRLTLESVAKLSAVRLSVVFSDGLGLHPSSPPWDVSFSATAHPGGGTSLQLDLGTLQPSHPLILYLEMADGLAGRVVFVGLGESPSGEPVIDRFAVNLSDGKPRSPPRQGAIEYPAVRQTGSSPGSGGKP